MALLNTITPENAEGAVKEAYDYFNELAGMVPLPLEMLSVSPFLTTAYIDTVKYYLNESNLSFSLLAHIRLLVAKEENYPYCVNLNHDILMKFGNLSKEKIDLTLENEDAASLEPNELAMLKFVIDAIRDPATTNNSDIIRLHEMGWSDRDIFEAVNEGLLMVTRGMAFKAFKIGEVG